MTLTQGQIANFNGRDLENIIEVAITHHLNVPVDYYSRTEERENILLKNVPYVSIYGTNCRSEFVLHYKGRSIRIECKSQRSSGSCSEKLPYLFYNFRDTIPETESAIIITGKGFRYGTKEWLYRRAKGTTIQVFSPTSFVSWLKNGCPPKKLPFYKTLWNKCTFS